MRSEPFDSADDFFLMNISWMLEQMRIPVKDELNTPNTIE